MWIDGQLYLLKPSPVQWRTPSLPPRPPWIWCPRVGLAPSQDTWQTSVWASAELEYQAPQRESANA